MSETQEQTPAAPVIDVNALRAEMQREAEERATKIVEGKAADIAAQAAQKTRVELAELISGKEKEVEINPTTQRLLTDTEGTLSAYADVVAERVLNQVEQKQQQKELVQSVFASRPDISSSKLNQSAVAVFLSEIQKKKPELVFGDALSEAIRKFDIEKERETKSVTPEATGVSPGGGGKPAAVTEKSEDELLREEIAERKADEAKKRRLSY